MRAWIKDHQKFRIMLSTIGLYIVTLTLALTWRDASSENRRESLKLPLEERVE